MALLAGEASPEPVEAVDPVDDLYEIVEHIADRLIALEAVVKDGSPSSGQHAARSAAPDDLALTGQRSSSGTRRERQASPLTALWRGMSALARRVIAIEQRLPVAPADTVPAGYRLSPDRPNRDKALALIAGATPPLATSLAPIAPESPAAETSGQRSGSEDEPLEWNDLITRICLGLEHVARLHISLQARVKTIEARQDG